MRAAPVVWSLWPGLRRLWHRGEWPALLAAISFGALLNAVLLLTFVWQEVLPLPMRIAAWFALIGFWIASAGQSLRWRRGRGPENPEMAGLFLRAQNEYLKQHWFEAESLLRECIRVQSEDADARMLLASLLRRTGRVEMAREQLQDLRDCPQAGKWHAEIRHELRRLERTVQEDK